MALKSFRFLKCMSLTEPRLNKCRRRLGGGGNKQSDFLCGCRSISAPGDVSRTSSRCELAWANNLSPLVVVARSAIGVRVGNNLYCRIHELFHWAFCGAVCSCSNVQSLQFEKRGLLAATFYIFGCCVDHTSLWFDVLRCPDLWYHYRSQNSNIYDATKGEAFCTAVISCWNNWLSPDCDYFLFKPTRTQHYRRDCLRLLRVPLFSYTGRI